MKVFFGFDVTEKKDNERMDGDVFAVQRVSKEQEQHLEAQNENLEQLKQKAELPLVLRIIRIACGAVAVVGGSGVLRGVAKVGFAQALRNAPFLLLGVLACTLIWLVLHLLTRQKGKRVYAEETTEQVLDEHQEAVEENFQTLGVPADAPEMDVILFYYRRKGEKIRPRAKGLNEYFNPVMRAFLENNALCLADVGTRWEIPLEEITGIREIVKGIYVPGWNKGMPYNKGAYKPYKIAANNFGQIYLKPYYALEICRCGKNYELYFPAYELSLVEKLTGHTARKED